MRKMLLVTSLLLLVPVLGSAQVTPDSTRPMRQGMRGQMQDMTPEMRQAYQQGFRHGRMAAARGGRAGAGLRAPGARAGMRAPAQRGERMGRAGAPGMGLMGPALRTELGLSDEQVKKLDAIRDRQREVHRQGMEALRDDREKWLEQRELFRQQTRALMLEVLTPEQRTKLEALEKQGPVPGRRGRG